MAEQTRFRAGAGRCGRIGYAVLAWAVVLVIMGYCISTTMVGVAERLPPAPDETALVAGGE